MEQILIKGIEAKQTKNGKPFWVIKFNGNRQATIGAWDAPLAHFIENSVKVGGRVEVEIQQKGEYTNITKVNMNDNWVMGLGAEEVKVTMPPAITPQKSVMSDKDASIVAQVCVKEANNTLNALIKSGATIDFKDYGQMLSEHLTELVGAYKVALELLNE